MAVAVWGVDGLRPQVQRGLRDEGDRDRPEGSGDRAPETRVDAHHRDRDQREEQQVRGVAAEAVRDGRDGDARGRRDGREGVPHPHGAPSRSTIYRESA